ncbi:SDR family oxidoreductase [Marinobacter sp. KM021]|uniref:SDR family oxidoreductase n=1 Tax=Marinobacter sp. KM021 TaxID=3075616 RepID=UPI003D6A8C1D
MTILITGATGFIGKYLCLTLLQQGHEVQALIRSKSSLNQLTGFLQQQGAAMERFSALEGDLEKPDLELIALPDRIECLVHLAARFAWNLPEQEARHTNVTGSLRVAELARQLRCRLVFISGFMLANTGHLSRLGINRSHPEQTDWSRVYRRAGGYEASKLESAFRLREFVARQGMDAVEVQPATVAGHGLTGELDPAQPLYGLLENLYHGRLAMIPGSPEHWLPLIPVDSLAQVIAVACVANHVPGTLLALDQNTPNLAALLQAAAHSLGKPGPRRHLPIGMMKALLTIPGLPGLLKVAPESLAFIQTCRFDTTVTERFLAQQQVTLPPFRQYLQSSCRHYLESEAGTGKLTTHGA